MNFSSKIKVAVLRGGPSDGYEDSLKTGEHILSILRDMPGTYEPLDIFISKDGEWHRGGLPHEPHHALLHTDVVWNALHGLYGEDGQVQRVLEGLKIPFTGSSAAASTLAVNKDMAKRLYQKHSLLTPAYELVTENTLNESRLINIFRNYLLPVVVKPARRSIDVSLAYTLDELRQSVKKALARSPRVLVEEFVKGDEVTCTVIEGAKGERIYALLPASQELQRGEPSSQSKFRLKVEENKHIEGMAKRAHEILGLSHYSSSKFIISPKKKIYIVETNPLPKLHKDSSTHHSFQATGWRPRDFVDHVIKLAM